MFHFRVQSVDIQVQISPALAGSWISVGLQRTGHINNVITPDTSLLRVMLGILMSSGEGGTQLLFYLAANARDGWIIISS